MAPTSIDDMDEQEFAAFCRTAEAGPHGHWETFGIEDEGARFHLIHELLSSPTFDDAQSDMVDTLIRELESMAAGVGRGDADQFLSSAAPDDDDYSARHQMLTEGAGGNDYFSMVLASEAMLGKATNTAEARTHLNFKLGDGGGDGPIHYRMLAAYEEGRDYELSKADGPTTTMSP